MLLEKVGDKFNYKFIFFIFVFYFKVQKVIKNIAFHTKNYCIIIVLKFSRSLKEDECQVLIELLGYQNRI